MVKFIESPEKRKKTEVYDENRNPVEIVFRKYLVKNYTDDKIMDFGKMKYKYTRFADKIIINRLIADYSHLVGDKMLTRRRFNIRAALNIKSRIRLAAIKIFKDSREKSKDKYIFKIIFVEDI
jgi:hypothetical protein